MRRLRPVPAGRIRSAFLGPRRGAEARPPRAAGDRCICLRAADMGAAKGGTSAVSSSCLPVGLCPRPCINTHAPDRHSRFVELLNARPRGHCCCCCCCWPYCTQSRTQYDSRWYPISMHDGQVGCLFVGSVRFRCWQFAVDSTRSSALVLMVTSCHGLAAHKIGIPFRPTVVVC